MARLTVTAPHILHAHVRVAGRLMNSCVVPNHRAGVSCRTGRTGRTVSDLFCASFLIPTADANLTIFIHAFAVLCVRVGVCAQHKDGWHLVHDISPLAACVDRADRIHHRTRHGALSPSTLPSAHAHTRTRPAAVSTGVRHCQAWSE